MKIDKDDDTFYPNANGTVNLTPTPLAPGTHLLRVAVRVNSQFPRFSRASSRCRLKPLLPHSTPKLIEIHRGLDYRRLFRYKEALSDYAWLIGEQLGVQHTQIAFPGICLVDIQCYSPNPIGMSKQFFKLQTVLFPNSPNWNFSRYRASAVVINLGTNDNSRVTDDAFQSSYESFLRNIRKVYPKARIFVLRTFAGIKSAPTQAAIQAVGDSNVQYVDTTGWLSPSDTNDGI